MSKQLLIMNKYFTIISFIIIALTIFFGLISFFYIGVDGEEVTCLPKGIALRRNIREVMDETKLDESTLAAQRQEAERLRRVQEQQRLLRELQRQAAQERMQHKVMAMLQGSQFSKPGMKSGLDFIIH